MTRTVVIAPDSFKGTLAADDVARAMAAGWSSVHPDDRIELRPQADGGEGTLDAVEASVPGARRHRVPGVTGPDERPVVGEWVELPDGTGVVELAQMSGLPLMRELDPLGATSRGLGEVIAAVIDAGASRLLIGLGGSASTDGGLPALEAIGDRRPPEGGALLLADVTAPLLGPAGAAAVFGPQKGASPEQIALLEARLSLIAERLPVDPDEPGTGAAGGVAYGLRHWGATLASGSVYVAEATGLGAAIVHADVVLTGEGRFDGQSLTGKVVGTVIDRAAAAGVACGVIAGAAVEDPPCWIATLVNEAGSLRAAMDEPARWLTAAARRAARELVS